MKQIRVEDMVKIKVVGVGGGGSNVGDVHGAEHVTEVGQVTVGQAEVIDHDVPQIHNTGAIDLILLFYEGGKLNNFFTGKGFPVAVVIPVNTGTNKVDNQLARILARGHCICIRIAFQHLQVADKGRILCDTASSQSGYRQNTHDHYDRKDKCQPSGCLGCCHDNSISFFLHTAKCHAFDNFLWEFGKMGILPLSP